MSTLPPPADGEPGVPGASDTGGQQPTDEPRGGQTSADAAGSVRDRLRNPGPQSSGGDTRASHLTTDDFQNTDSRAQLQAEGRGEEQLSESRPPEAVEPTSPAATCWTPPRPVPPSARSRRCSC